MINIQQVRNRLVIWGEFWYYQEMGAGFGNNSPTGRAMETMRTGIYSQGTANQVSHTADSIHVSDEVLEVDDAVISLTRGESKAIAKKYKRHYKNDKEREEVKKSRGDILLDRAENKLCGLL